MSFEILKGTIDYEPELQIKINYIIDILKNNFQKNGFKPFDTPIIEYLETLTFKYDDTAEIVEEIYKLSDRGKRELGLRYDLTTPLSRYIALNPTLKKPFRRYHIGKVFRDGPLKKGRLREFIQCDCDIIGIENIECEIELMELFYNSYKDLQIKAIIEINNNKILRGILLQENIEEKNLSSIILSIDKLKKIGEKEVLKEIKEKNIDTKKVEKALINLKSTSLNDLKKIAKNEILKQGIQEIEELIIGLEKLNINYRVNFSMSRGLDIYTGNIWEAYDSEEKITSSIGSGGRYDNLIGEYTKNKEKTPAVGISFGLVPILECIKEKLPKKKTITQILIVPLEKEFYLQSLLISNFIKKQKNLNSEIYYEYNMKKAFKYCSNQEIEKILFIGKSEIEKQEFFIKNLITKKEKKIIIPSNI